MSSESDSEEEVEKVVEVKEAVRFKEIKASEDVLIFVIENKKDHEIIRKLMMKNLIDYEEVFKRYVGGDESMEKYIFDYPPERPSVIKKKNIDISLYKKYQNQNINIKIAFGAYCILDGYFKDALYVFGDMENDIGYYYMSIYHYKKEYYIESLKMVEKCNIVHNSVKYVKAASLFQQKKYVLALELYEQLVQYSFRLEHSAHSLGRIYEKQKEYLKAAENYEKTGNHFDKAISVYKKLGNEKYMEEIINCHIQKYEVHKYTTTAMDLAKLLAKRDDPDAIKWLKLAI